MAEEYAGVFLLDVPYCIDREYEYRIPDGMKPAVGGFVSVPFGNGNRHRLGIVNRLYGKSETDPEKVKPLVAVCPDRVSLDAEALGTLAFLKAHTLCTTGDAVHAMIPSAAISRLAEYYTRTGKSLPASASFDSRTLLILGYIYDRGRVGGDAIRSRFGAASGESLTSLLNGGYIERELEIKQSIPDKTESAYSLAVKPDDARRILSGDNPDVKKPASAGQRAVLSALIEREGDEPMPESLLRRSGEITRPHLNALVKKGLITETKSVLRRDLDLLGDAALGNGERTTLVLNDEQSAALETLSSLASDGAPHGALLYGVTGSGKTCVMLALIDRILDSGRGAIVLLPEIALTPQSLAIFCSRYGKRVAVLHSGLSAGERYDAYVRIRDGDADLVIGTRSAVFAPVKNLGLIVIDEEQEHTYKSDMSPRYHARDIARWRCADRHALMLLASATPSLESRQKAEEGKYTLVRLDTRYGAASLPDVTICDMRGEPRSGNLTPIGTLLADSLRGTYERGEQSILFLNRRGYNNYISCVACGAAVTCPSCSVSMTYHTRRNSYNEGELVCHWCGRRMPLPDACPECHSSHLIRMGYGTQRVEQELGQLLPGAKILRMDTDTTSTKRAYDELLGAFRRHEGDVLLGTQMVTKGHDFPDVTLVGVLLADASLYYDDFRAEERTFAMLTQVIGRAGRRDRPGKAIIQTNNPQHEVIQLARDQDYDTFFRREIRLRRAFTFPPYCDLALLTVTSSVEKDVVSAVKKLADMLHDLAASEKFSGVPLITFGPFEAPVYRVDGKYRMRMIVKCRLNATSRLLFATVVAEFSRSGTRAPSLSVDFNPTNI